MATEVSPDADGTQPAAANGKLIEVRDLVKHFPIRGGGLIRHQVGEAHAVCGVSFDLAEEIPFTSSIQITLLLSIFKFDRMEWAIEKCTELGAARIIPVIARRTDSHLAAASMKRVERWQRIALQSAEQSRRSAP